MLKSGAEKFESRGALGIDLHTSLPEADEAAAEPDMMRNNKSPTRPKLGPQASSSGASRSHFYLAREVLE